MDDPILLSVGAALVVALILHHFLVERPREARLIEARTLTVERGARPLTRHPQIDYDRCLACGSCIAACPETHGADAPLAFVYGRLELVNPLRCVGHGACELACPSGALKVTLGELANDPDVPRLTPTGESSLVKGLFLAGEVSGVPLVKNAITQGTGVIEEIAARLHGARRGEGVLDVAIVGLGPAGFAAALKAHELRLDYVAIEQGELGGTVASYPRQKLVLTSPVELPLYGTMKAREITKEELIAIWRTTAERHRIRTRVRQKVESLTRDPWGIFELQVAGETVRARTVVLALGRRGTPRKLGVAGEDLEKVSYSLADPGLHRGKSVLVVGGGDSAVEAALALAKENRVTLSYRGESFFRIKARNSERIAAAAARGQIDVRFRSQVAAITEGAIALREPAGERVVDNDLVIVLVGGEPPAPFLRAVGVLPPKPEERVRARTGRTGRTRVRTATVRAAAR